MSRGRFGEYTAETDIVLGVGVMVPCFSLKPLDSSLGVVEIIDRSNRFYHDEHAF